MNAISDTIISDDPDIGSAELDADTEQQPQRWRASVSLESDTQPVLMWRGEVQAASAAMAASRAIRATRKAFPKRKARSWAIVVEKV